MSEGTLRILHTGDWRLNMPCQGIRYYSPSIASSLSTAVFDSISRTIDFAIGENVDAFVIGGNVLDPDLAAPSDYEFIHQQLCRLEETNIPVVWGWSQLDKRAHWPRCIDWPSNVNFLIGDTPLNIEIPTKNGTTINFLGLEPNSALPVCPDDYRGMKTDNFTLGVAYGELSVTEAPPECQHWLLTGAGYSHTEYENGVRVYYCGSPLGRSATELGPHGSALLDLNNIGEIDYQFINTSGVEYHVKTISANAVTAPDALSRLIVESILGSSWDNSIVNIIQMELINAPVSIESLPLLPNYPAFHSAVQDDLNQIGAHLLFAGISVSSPESDRPGNEQELLGEFLFELRELHEQGWESLPLRNFIGLESDPTWCTVQEDLTGLKILQGVECLGRHLLNGIERDVA